MGVLFTNNAVSSLQFSAAAASTQITLAAGTGAQFPQPVNPGDYFMLTLENTNVVPTQREIVQVTGRSGDTLTVVRAQEGTTAQSWNVGAVAAHRVTAAVLTSIVGNLATQSNVVAALGYTPASAAGGALSGLLSVTGVGILALTVSSVAALRAVSFALLQSGTQIEVLGYYSAGDGGGGVFYWNSSATATDDGGTVINPTGNSGAGRLLRMGLQREWDWRWFGAYGDNSHDDSAAIQACYTAAGAWLAAGSFNGAQRVEIVPSPGLYLISQTISISWSNIVTRAPTLQGAGVNMNSATADHFDITAGSTKINNVWFFGIIFQRSVTATAGYVLNFNYVYFCGIVNCRIYGNNTQYNGAIFTSALQCYVNGNRIEATIAEAVVLAGQSGTGMQTSDVYFDNNSFPSCNSGEPAVTGGSAPRGVITLKDYVQGIFFNPTNEVYAYRGWAYKLYGTLSAGTAGNELIFIDHPNVDGGSTAITTGLGAGALYVSNFNNVQVNDGWIGSTNLDAVYIDAGCNGVYIGDVWIEPQNNAGASILGNAVTINSTLVVVKGCFLNGGNISLGVPFNILSGANYIKLLDNDVEQFTSAAAIYSAPSGWAASATYTIRPGITILNGSAVIGANLAVNPFTTTSTGAIAANFPDSSTFGGNARGSLAVDLQMARSSASQVASGANSTIIGGSSNTATGQFAIAGGATCFANATYGVALGHNAAAAGTAALSVGNFTNATEPYSVTLGSYAYDWGSLGKFCYSSGQIATQGDNQAGLYVLKAALTNATGTRLTGDGNSAGTANSMPLPSNSSIRFSGQVVARNTSTGATCTWTVAGAIKNVGGTMTLLGSTVTQDSWVDSGTSSWALTLAADSTNKCLSATVTGAASTNIHVAMRLDSAEVI